MKPEAVSDGKLSSDCGRNDSSSTSSFIAVA